MGDLLLRSLAVNGGCPVVRGVIWAFWGFVVTFLEVFLHVAWNYPEEYVDISMPGDVKKDLKKCNHKPQKRPDHAPHDWTSPFYGQRTQQQVTHASTAPLLPPAKKQRIQAIVGTFLYYGLGFDSTILVNLNEIGG